jgi:hypothetical protein
MSHFITPQKPALIGDPRQLPSTLRMTPEWLMLFHLTWISSEVAIMLLIKERRLID